MFHVKHPAFLCRAVGASLPRAGVMSALDVMNCRAPVFRRGQTTRGCGWAPNGGSWWERAKHTGAPSLLCLSGGNRGLGAARRGDR